ncbi:tetratricopeptide repeat protein [Candidatus Margulisiibacteriota bacterium]
MRNKKFLLKIFFISLILFAFLLKPSSFAVAQAYEIPPDLLKELKENRLEVEKSPTSARAHFEMAMSYAYTGLVELGLKSLEQVEKEDPFYADKVIEEYENKSKKEPNEWKHKFKLAFGYYFKKQRAAAKICFQEILQKHPKHIWAMGYLALLEGEQALTEKEHLQKQGLAPHKISEKINPKYQKIIDMCNQALEIEPNATAIRFLLGQAYFNRGNITDYFGVMVESLNVLRLREEDNKFLEEHGL